MKLFEKLAADKTEERLVEPNEPEHKEIKPSEPDNRVPEAL